MSEETLKQMEDRWAVLMAARYGSDHSRRGERIFEVDAKYAREVTALGVQISERRAAEASKPRINADQLQWLERAQGARDASGKLLTEASPVYAKNLRAAREKVFDGGDITGVIDATEHVLAEQKATLPTIVARPTTQSRDRDGNIRGDAHLMPAAIDITPALPQAINTNRGPK